MSSVQFEEEPVSTQNKAGFITRLAISSGVARDERQANLVLTVGSILLLVSSVAFYIVANQPKQIPATPAQVTADLTHSPSR